MSKKHELFTIKLTDPPVSKLDKDKYKGMENELLLRHISFSDSNNIGDNRGGRTLHVTYPTFTAFDEGEAAENRDNAEEAVNKLRKLVANKEIKEESIVLSKWRQHSKKKDEYILVRSQEIKDGVIYTQEFGGDVTAFVLQSLDNNQITDKTQTDPELQEEKAATHVEQVVPTNT